MLLVARQDGTDQRRGKPVRRGQRREEGDVARERAPSERATRRHVGAPSDARLAADARLDLAGIRTDALAQRGDLVDEGHGCRRGKR